MFDNMRVALIGLGSNKLRSALTMLGITIGVAAVIVLVTLGQAVEQFVQKQFMGIGTNLVIVFATDNLDGTFRPLTLGDVQALQDPFRVPDALYVLPQRALTLPVEFEGRQTTIRVLGTTVDYLAVRSRYLVAGNFFTQTDMDGQSRVAYLGQETVRKLFAEGVYPVGQTIRIGDVSFRVEGVLNVVGGSGFGPNDDDVIIAPLTTVLNRLVRVREVSGDFRLSNLVIQARDANSVSALSAEIREVLRDVRKISFRDEDNFQIFTQTDLLASLGNITQLLTVFLGIIAGISLLVGGIGIMNIMLVTVTERTREIGLRKAVGAQRSDIMQQFLVEAVTLALVGGGIGIAIATGGTALLGAVLPEVTAQVQTSSVLLATGISVGIGVFFGLYPANRASALNPIDALRYE